ncbi:class I tRNA ligase family protein [Dactylosporangium vinaceum]|uniref:Class I tRNA ligase family protein n=1 Tax=Dactylosporangium vinaceum TaxID=53362 RepID=A0ABV5M3V2_9ACTN|nr:class I tRNA ligase family protein [Dactylosporangium vinaceum]UAB93539.1 class I tRNA ligase family protein [Dactylosporangium vinaceum]
MAEPEPLVDVVSIPPPTANGPLHIGHLSGPYLAADFAARAARARGEHVLAMAGVDVHQNWVLTRAELDGVDVDKMVDGFRDDIVEAFRRARIDYDAFIDPRAPGYAEAMATMAGRLVESGALPQRTITLHRCAGCARTLHHSYVEGLCGACGHEACGGGCEGCGGFTSAQDMTEVRCARCGGAAVPLRANVPVLDLEAHRPALQSLWLRAELPVDVRALIDTALSRPLPVIPAAYPTDWGVAGSGPIAGLRLDVYVEVCLNFVRGVAQCLRPGVAEDPAAMARVWNERVRGMWNFYGIDNAYFYGIMWPALLATAGVDLGRLAGMSVVNRFFTLDGFKFSTSRNHAVWANDLLADADPAIVRLFLAFNRPDRVGSDFTREAFDAFTAYVRPLLAGHPHAESLPAALRPAEQQRGELALRYAGFDAPLAARALLSLLAAGPDGAAEAATLRAVLTGGD